MRFSTRVSLRLRQRKNYTGNSTYERFQKIKIKEWEEFGKQYPFSWTREIKDSWLYVVCFILIISFAIIPQIMEVE